MIVSVHQPQYLPWLGYFDKIKRSDCFVFLDNVQYKHREYQNRNKIRTKDGWMWLSVPVLSKGLREQLICDVKIDKTVDWQEKHRRSIEVCYNKANFFADYSSFSEEVYKKNKWDKLVDLNVYIIRRILKELDIDKPIHFESDIKTTKKGTERIIEICKSMRADTYLSGIGGKQYLEEDRFAKEGIKLKYQDFSHPVYQQCFSKTKVEFIPNMAAIDLLFNEGPTSKDILKG